MGIRADQLKRIVSGEEKGNSEFRRKESLAKGELCHQEEPWAGAVDDVVDGVSEDPQFTKRETR